MGEDFAALDAAGRDPQLVIGPWTHTAPGLLATSMREGLGWLRARLLDDDRLLQPGAVRVFAIQFGQRPDRMVSAGSYQHAVDCVMRLEVTPYLAPGRPNLVVFDEDLDFVLEGARFNDAVHTAFLRAVLFPPPAARTGVGARFHRSGARCTADTLIPLVV